MIIIYTFRFTPELFLCLLCRAVVTFAALISDWFRLTNFTACLYLEWILRLISEIKSRSGHPLSSQTRCQKIQLILEMPYMIITACYFRLTGGWDTSRCSLYTWSCYSTIPMINIIHVFYTEHIYIVLYITVCQYY